MLAVALVLATTLLSFVLTGSVRRYVVRHELLDEPNHRSSHSTPTPRGGGLGLVLAFLVALAIAIVLGVTEGRDVFVIGIGTLVLAALGWIDDTRSLPARYRLAAQLAVAASTIIALGGLPRLQLGFGSFHLGVAGLVFGAIGIVWSINLFNFMDGIDGLAGSQALFTLGIAACLLFVRDADSLGVVAALIAAGAAGFLVWNWPPAKIFMGDCGSGAIGYAIAAIAVASENRGAVPLLVFVMLNGVFVFDATTTLIRRISRGHSPAAAHREHAYQRLARFWGAHRPVTLASAALSCVLGALAAGAIMAPSFLPYAFVFAGVLLAVATVLIERRAPM